MSIFRHARSKAEPADDPQGRPARGPRKGALTSGSADGYQYREDHSWDADQQQGLADKLKEISEASD